MTYSKKDLINYRFQRANESLDEAKILAKSNHWNTVANRLYYSMYYAINALFVKHGIKSSTHSGTKFQFHKEFIKDGSIDIDAGKLFNKRQEGDYQDFQTFEKENIEPLITKVESFLKEINELLFDK